MTLLNTSERIRVEADSKLDTSNRSRFGQFFTPMPLATYMASLFQNFSAHVTLLDPGCGAGTLSAAAVGELVRREKTRKVCIHSSDIEKIIFPYALQTFEECSQKCEESNIKISHTIRCEDYILSTAKKLAEPLFQPKEVYTHVIMNPPYRKIKSTGEYRKALQTIGIESANLYSAFISLAIKELKDKGELVAIIPRSFCNGVYYRGFREYLLRTTAIKHIHIFDSRNSAFKGNSVLQETIIVHLVKGASQEDVVVTSSRSADFYYDKEKKKMLAPDMTSHSVPFSQFVNLNDSQKFLHIIANREDQNAVDALACFTCSLEQIGIQVSTGPVVDFRVKECLREKFESGLAPLIFPTHLKGVIAWPKKGKKPNAIAVASETRSQLWENNGSFLLVRRFSSKEEKRRIVATLCGPDLPGELIGFDNKLNVYHAKKRGLTLDVARGLYIYLNSSVVDRYYRLFGGHTQVNATDLRNIMYPDLDALNRLGRNIDVASLSQSKIDLLLQNEIENSTN